MTDFRRITALFVDIDDTIIRFKDGATSASLFQVLQTAGTTLGGLDPDEVSRRIAHVKAELRWWHLSDFIVALELNPKKFWRFALETERAYVEPTGPEIPAALQRLRDAGILLFVASNNPSSGILHKLSLAGLATIQGAPLFSQLLGCTELQAMKWEPEYWQKALAHTGLDAGEVAVVGDNPHDDYAVPHTVGIGHTFLIDRSDCRSDEDTDHLTYVTSFDRIADLVIGPQTQRRMRPQYASPPQSREKRLRTITAQRP